MAVLTATIGGSPATIRRNPAFCIHDMLQGTPNTATFSVDNLVPAVNQDVRVLNGAALVFAGTVQTVVQRFEGLPTNLVYDVSAIDYTWTLNAIRPYGEWGVDVTGAPVTSVTTIVQTLVASFASGFTAVNVQTSLPAVAIILDGSQDFATVLSNLAQLVGCHWYVDYTKDVHFFIPS